MMKLIKRYGCGLLFGLLPSALVHADVSRQIIYHFDPDRMLVLVGNNCQGTVFYIDNKQKFATEVTSGFRLSTFAFIHPSEKYIAIPYRDLSGLMVSRDYGRTFEAADFSPAGGAVRYQDSHPSPDEVVSFTVVGDQGFFLTKQNYIYVSSKPFGKRWGLDYMSLNAIPRLVYRDWDNFKDMPTSVPEVKDYKGWTHMRCDPTK